MTTMQGYISLRIVHVERQLRICNSKVRSWQSSLEEGPLETWGCFNVSVLKRIDL